MDDHGGRSEQPANDGVIDPGDEWIDDILTDALARMEAQLVRARERLAELEDDLITARLCVQGAAGNVAKLKAMVANPLCEDEVPPALIAAPAPLAIAGPERGRYRPSPMTPGEKQARYDDEPEAAPAPRPINATAHPDIQPEDDEGAESEPSAPLAARAPPPVREEPSTAVDTAFPVARPLKEKRDRSVPGTLARLWKIGDVDTELLLQEIGRPYPRRTLERDLFDMGQSGTMVRIRHADGRIYAIPPAGHPIPPNSRFDDAGDDMIAAAPVAPTRPARVVREEGPGAAMVSTRMTPDQIAEHNARIMAKGKLKPPSEAEAG